MFDVLIQNGFVIDGTGSPGKYMDVGIKGGVITAAGQITDTTNAAQVIDASGLVVTPGFIDSHVHSDVMLLHEPQNEPKLRQGVTTEVLSQDGLSYAPLSPLKLQQYRRYLAALNGNPPILWNWSTVAEFRQRFDRTVAVNTAYLVPHGAIRLETVGWCDVPLTGEKMKEAQNLVRQGLDEGAVGFSTGLSYYPCSYADTQELIELCRPVAERGFPYVVHQRTVFRGERFDKIQETLSIGRESGVPIHFSHFRTGPSNAGKVAERLAPVDKGQEEGLDITLELYPYPSGSGTMLEHLPPWAHEGGPDHLLARLADPQQRDRIKAEIHTQNDERGRTWDDYIFSHIPSARNRDLISLTVPEAAHKRGAPSSEDLLLDLLIQEELEIGFRGPTTTPEILEQLAKDHLEMLSRPNYMVGSDSISVGEFPHPRTYGTFPRILGRLRRQIGQPSLETLINRCTQLPATRFGLTDRGVIETGKAADIVVFDADSLTDEATYDEPKRYPVGIEYVLVNGEISIEGGKPTGVLAGRALPR